MSRKTSHSKEKFEELIRNELNVALRKMSDNRLTMCSVTKVELAKDYSSAKVYWDTYNDSMRGDIKKAIEGAAGKLRTILASVLDVRHTPSMHLEYDSQAVDEQRITELLRETKDGQN